MGHTYSLTHQRLLRWLQRGNGKEWSSNGRAFARLPPSALPGGPLLERLCLLACSYRGNMAISAEDILAMVVTFFVPPIGNGPTSNPPPFIPVCCFRYPEKRCLRTAVPGVLIYNGCQVDKDFLIDVLLTILGWLPGAETFLL
jgi:uncharacterized membrane protein YqaE (UPF0057 family)